jgi:hypothetical protein
MNRWLRLVLVVLILVAGLAGVWWWLERTSDQAKLLRLCRHTMELANRGDFLKLDEVLAPDLRDALNETGGLRRISQIMVRADLAERAHYEFVGVRELDLDAGRAVTAFRRVADGGQEQPFDVVWRRGEDGWKAVKETLDQARFNTPGATDYLGL